MLVWVEGERAGGEGAQGTGGVWEMLAGDGPSVGKHSTTKFIIDTMST